MAYLWDMDDARQYGVELLRDRPKPLGRIKTQLSYSQWRQLTPHQRAAYERQRRANQAQARNTAPTARNTEQAAINLAGLAHMASVLGIKNPGLAKAPPPAPPGPTNEQIHARFLNQQHPTTTNRTDWAVPGVDPVDRS